MVRIDWLKAHFSKNPGWEENLPFKLECMSDSGAPERKTQLISVDTIVENDAITRFQGIVLKSYGSSVCEDIMEFPIWLFPHVAGYEILTYYKEINSLCYTVWFKEPLTKEKWDEISKGK